MKPTGSAAMKFKSTPILKYSFIIFGLNFDDRVKEWSWVFYCKGEVIVDGEEF